MRLVPALVLAFVALAAPAFAIDASSLDGKVLTGYQGWFRCPGDGSGSGFERGYLSHNGPKGPDRDKPGTRQWGIDMWPDTSDMDTSSLCPVEGKTKNGKKLQLFTAFAPATQQTHFRWMREHAIDGVLFQRFLYRLKHDYAEKDRVLQNIIGAARDNDRVFAIEYDVTDYKGDVFEALKSDWTRLNDQYAITRAKGYQHHRGKPVVSLWGFGFGDGRHIDDPDKAMAIIDWFKAQGLTVMGGVPGHWNTLGDGSVKDPRWVKVYAAFDIVQPWSVGRYQTRAEFAQWAARQYPGDVATTRRDGQDYMPVIYPGFSWKNNRPQAKLNQIPREGGDFLWQQAVAAKKAGAKMVKVAMFDEVNEATAIFKVAATRDQTPEDGEWVTLDADGKALPGDYYLTLTGRIGALFKEP